LTLGGPVAPAMLDSVQQFCERTWRATDCNPRFTVRDIMFLWLTPGSLQNGWRQIITHHLNPKPPQSNAAAAAVTSRTSTTGRPG
jgi:hypothetical protein